MKHLIVVLGTFATGFSVVVRAVAEDDVAKYQKKWEENSFHVEVSDNKPSSEDMNAVSILLG